MVVSSIVNAVRQPGPAADYRALIADRPTLISFATVTEMRYGALKAGWGEFRRRGLERDLARFAIIQPDDRLMHICARLRTSCERDGHALGQKVHESDRWIASSAIRLGIELVSDDSIFADVPDLIVISQRR
jgi:hypothetical protein